MRYKKVNCVFCCEKYTKCRQYSTDECPACDHQGWILVSDDGNLYTRADGHIIGSWRGQFQNLDDQGVADYSVGSPSAGGGG